MIIENTEVADEYYVKSEGGNGHYIHMLLDKRRKILREIQGPLNREQITEPKDLLSFYGIQNEIILSRNPELKTIEIKFDL